MAVQLVSNGRNSYYNTENYSPQNRIVRTPTIRDDEDDDYTPSREIERRRAEVANVAPRRSKGSVPKAGRAAPAAALRAPKSPKPAVAKNTVAVPAEWLEVNIPSPVAKKPVSLRIDEDVLAFFKKGGRKYQSRINAVLKQFMLFQTDTEMLAA